MTNYGPTGKEITTAQPDQARSLGFVLDQGTRERLRRVIDDGTPPNTRRAYESDLRYFWSWCSAIGWTDEPIYPVPPEVVARFVVDHLEGLDDDIDQDLLDRGVKTKPGKHAMNTIDRRVSALSALHKTRGLPSPITDPIVSQVLSKARKAAARRGERPNKKKAVIKKTLDLMLETCEAGSMLDKRDAALLLFGWSSGGRRRSEIVGAEMLNLEEVGDSYIYHLGITKTEQEGDGGTVPITGRAAEALRAWLQAAAITKGPIFRSVSRYGYVSKKPLSGRAVALIVKARIKAADLNPEIYAGHSLRSGFLTEVGLQGKSLLEAMALSRHKTVQVAAGYHQSGAALHNETASLAG